MNLEKTSEIISATGKIKEGKKFIAVAIVAAVMLIIYLVLIAPKLKKVEMPNVIDLRGEKAKQHILETGITEDRIIFKELEDEKSLADCKNYTGDVHKVFVLETNPESGKQFHVNTDVVNVGVKTVDNIATEAVGSNPELLMTISDKYGFEIEALNTYHKNITDLVKKDPAVWIVKEIRAYDSSANAVTCSVIGSKEYEEKIKKEEEARVAEEKRKAEEAKKADEERRKEEEAAKKKEEENKDGFEDGDGDPYHFTGDKDKKYTKWAGHKWSRPVSYNDMVEIFDSYTKLYYSTELSYDNYEEEDEALSREVAEQYDITYDDFMCIFSVIDNEVVVATRQKYQTMKDAGVL